MPAALVLEVTVASEERARSHIVWYLVFDAAGVSDRWLTVGMGRQIQTCKKKRLKATALENWVDG